jgi:hypothetical protein
MPSSTEVVQALYGTWRFARLDRSAMRFFDLSHSGVWRSFWAAALCYPLYIALLLLRLDADTIAQSGLLHILIVQTIAFVAGWAAFPLIVLGFCRWIGHEEQGFDFIVVYNWSQVLQAVVSLLAAVVVMPLLPEDLGQDVSLMTDAALIAYEWFIALIAIGAGGWIAAAAVLIDVMLSALLLMTAASLY